jgi:nucleoside phosphorylase
MYDSKHARRVQAALHRTRVPAVSPRLADPEFKGLDIPWPKGLAPRADPITPSPSKNGRLPRADAIAMMDTDAEAEAMSDVFTPDHYFKTDWYTYARDFDSYQGQFGPNSATWDAPYLGKYYVVYVGKLKVIVYKTNLHMHDDSKKMPDGSYSLPLKQMLRQIIDEARPRLFLTTGTAGGVYPKLQEGDVMVTRAAHFLCTEDYAKAKFNGKTYKSKWTVPKQYAGTAHKLMRKYAKNLIGKGTPPSKQCSTNDSNDYPVDIYFDGEGIIPPYHPILTTDSFMFGTSKNKLYQKGVAVEMDDAVLGLVCKEMEKPPLWASVRNYSDPCINGDLPYDEQKKCADFYYDEYGYWTTVMSGITSWAILAGFGEHQ